MFTEGDVRAAVTAALQQVAEFSDDERDELDAIVDGAVGMAVTARENRTGDVSDNDVSGIETDDLMIQFVGIAREKKALTAREKALNKRKEAINGALLTLAEQAVIMPPWKVDGATIFLSSRVWAKLPPIPGIDDMPDDAAEQAKAAAKAKAIEYMKNDDDLATFVKEDFNVMSLSSFFKDEIDHERLPLNDDGEALLGDGALLVKDTTECRVRGA